MFGGQVGVGGHLTIGRGAIAVGQSGVTNSLDARAMVAGYPAIDSREWRKASVLFRRLPELKRRIEAARSAPRASSARASDPNPKGHPSDIGPFAVIQCAALALVVLVCARSGAGAGSRASRRDPAHDRVEFLPRTGISPHRASISPATTPSSSGTRTSAARSMSIDYGAGRATFVANYQVDPRRRDSTLRSQPGQLHPERVRVHAARGGSRWRASSIISRAIWRSGQRVAVAWNMMGGRVRRRVHVGRSCRCACRCAGRVCEDVRGLRLGDRSCGAQRRADPSGGWCACPRSMSVASAWTARRIAAIKPDIGPKAASVVEGRAGAMEFFLAGERRIDPYPLEFGVGQMGDRRLSSAEPLTSGIIN